jgi:hypothetical protein
VVLPPGRGWLYWREKAPLWWLLDIPIFPIGIIRDLKAEHKAIRLDITYQLLERYNIPGMLALNNFLD